MPDLSPAKIAPLFPGYWKRAIFCALLAVLLAFGLRMLEWPRWQNPEYSLNGEMLLATHDAYHWLAGAVGFGRASGHPMAVMLEIISTLTGLSPATVAFWFPAVLASLVSGVVFAWVWTLGSMEAGIAAGLITSIAPGFLGRTLLGYYDTDLVTLFFPLLITLAPACFAMRFLLMPRMAMGALFNQSGLSGWLKNAFLKKGGAPDPKKSPHLRLERPAGRPGNPLRWIWIICLALSGILSWWAQEWHSVFPYLIRYNVGLLFLLILLLGGHYGRCRLLLAALAYAGPCVAGHWGLLFILAPLAANCRSYPALGRQLACPWFLVPVWLGLGALLLNGDIFTTLINQVNAYLKNGGDTHGSGETALVFPSVAQSIIEVQDLSYAALFSYFHPWLEAALIGMAGFIAAIFKRPGLLFLLPLACLGLLSSRLGGRMVMFGAPIVAIGLTLPVFWLVRWLCPPRWKYPWAGWIACVLLCAAFVAPFVDMIPALSQGPIINRRHASALVQAGAISPPDAQLWLWWDWGYAAHYFARRETIADGAEHGGPSLYLPAAVFATANPRFARQVISYAASKGGEAGAFFKGLDAAGAQELINRLKSPETPLIRGKGRQYLITSFEMLRLGFWISNFGNWNFVTRQGEGGALSIVTQALSYRLKTGEVRLGDSPNIIFPSSISVFEETGLVVRDYVREWFESHPNATLEEQRAWLATRRNINFLFNRVTDEKLAVDQGIFNSLMTRLLLCDPHDPKITPYFRLVYDNIFARIYEVMPIGETKW